MVTKRHIGSVEGSTLALIDTLGELGPWDRVTAETALALAKAVDTEWDGSKLASLTRQLLSVVGALAAARAPAARPADEDEPAAPADPIDAILDEVARKRAERTG